MRRAQNDNALAAGLRRVPIVGQVRPDGDGGFLYPRPTGYLFLRDGEPVGGLEVVDGPISPPAE